MFHRTDLDSERGALAGEIGCAIVRGESDRNGLFLTGLRTEQPGFEIFEHASLAHGDLHVFALAALEELAVDASFKIHGDPIAVARLALHCGKNRPLLAQVFDHGVDILLRHLGNGLFHIELQPLQCNFRKHLESSAIFQIRPLAHIEWFDARTGCGTEFFLHHGFGKRGLHQLVEHFDADLRPKLLAHHVHRHLAWPETLQTHGATHILEAIFDCLLDAGRRHLDIHAPFQSTGRLNGNLHCLNLCDHALPGLPALRRYLPNGAKGGTRTLTGLPTGT